LAPRLENPERAYIQKLAVRVAEVAEGLPPFVAAKLGLLALVFGEFFFGVRVGIAGGEHRVGLGRLALLLAQAAKFVADLAQRRVYGLDLDEQVADFFQKVVEVIGTNDIGQASLLDGAGELADGHFRYQEETAKAATFFHGNRGDFAQGEEARRVNTKQRDIGDYQRPHTDAELGKELSGVGRDANAPAFGVEHLAEGDGRGTLLVEDQDVYRERFGLSRGRHFWSIGGCEAVVRKDGDDGGLRGTCT